MPREEWDFLRSNQASNHQRALAGVLVAFLLAAIAPTVSADEMPDLLPCIEEPSTNSNFPYCSDDQRQGGNLDDGQNENKWDGCARVVEDKIKETVAAALKWCWDTRDTDCEVEFAFAVQGEHPQVESYNWYMEVNILESSDHRWYRYESTELTPSQPLGVYSETDSRAAVVPHEYHVRGDVWITSATTDGREDLFGNPLNTAKIARTFYCFT